MITLTEDPPAACARTARPRSTTLKAVGALMVAAGLAALVVLAWQLWWTDLQAADRSESLIATMRQDFSPARESPVLTDGAAPPAATATNAGADPAIVHLPTLEEVHPVLPGVGADVLDQGLLGRYPGSANPGEIGNFAVAGHRTTYGRPLWALAELAPGDPVVVETPEAYHVYVVQRLRVVDPAATEVLAPTPDQPDTAATEAWMVLTTCHPRFSAEQRLVAYAALDRSLPRAQGLPPELTAGSD